MQDFFLSFIRLLLAPLLIASGTLAMQPVDVSPTTTPPQQTDIPVDTDDSLNWAGYVAQTGEYTAISGTWVVPTVAAKPQGTADATWVGIGGVRNRDLLQAGTQAIVENDGTVVYQAWYETLPGYSTSVPLAISPGDRVSTSIQESSPGLWHIEIRNETSGQTFSKNVAYDSSRSSAEWIEEMVSNGDHTFRPLDAFGSVSFISGGTVDRGVSKTISQSGAQGLSMVNGVGDVLAQTSGLRADGGFSVSRTDAPVDLAQAPAPVYVIRFLTPQGQISGNDPDVGVPITITFRRHQSWIDPDQWLALYW